MGCVKKLVGACLVVVLVTFLVELLILGIQNQRLSEAGDCAKEMRKLAQALILYSEAYDDRYPPARGWKKSLLASPSAERAVLQDDDFACGAKSGRIRFAFASWMGSVDRSTIERPEDTLVLSEYDGDVISTPEGILDRFHHGRVAIADATGRTRVVTAGAARALARAAKTH